MPEDLHRSPAILVNEMDLAKHLQEVLGLTVERCQARVLDLPCAAQLFKHQAAVTAHFKCNIG